MSLFHGNVLWTMAAGVAIGLGAKTFLQIRKKE
jgi:hypothetical protein